MKLGDPIDVTPDDLSGGEAAANRASGFVLGKPDDIVPDETGSGMRLGNPIDPLDDFDVYLALEDEREKRGYDPDDPGVGAKVWGNVKDFVGGLWELNKEVLSARWRMASGAKPVKGSVWENLRAQAEYRQEVVKDMAALVSQGVGKFAVNYSILGQGAWNVVANKWSAKIAEWIGDESLAPAIRRESRRATWEFLREARDLQQFGDNFNREIAVLLPERMAWLGTQPVNNKAAQGLADVLDPTNFIPGLQGAGASVRVPLKGAVRAAEYAAKGAALDLARAGAAREAATLLMRPGVTGAERETLRRGILQAGKTWREASERAVSSREAYLQVLESQRAELARMAYGPSLPQRLAGRGLRVAGGAVDRAGRVLQAVAGAPAAIARKLAPGNEAAEAAVRDVAQGGLRDVAGMVGAGPAVSGVAASTLRRAGQDMRIIGEVLGQAEGQLPFFRRLARETGGVTGWLASAIDQLRLAPLATAIGRTAAQGVRGAPFMGAMAYAGSGGDTEQIVPGMGMGAFFGMAGAGLGQWQRFRSPDQVRWRQDADVGRYRQLKAKDGVDMAFFDRLPRQDQVAIATFQFAHPDLAIHYVRMGKGRSSFYTTGGENGPVAMINLDSRDPVRAVAAHEVAHDVEKRGLWPAIRRELLGDENTGRPGMYTLLDAEGKPVFDDAGRFRTTPEWAELKRRYQSRLDAESDRVGHDFGKLDDEALAREVFAEHAADWMLGADPKTGESNIARSMRAPSDRLLRGLAETWLGRRFGFMQGLAGKTGAVMGADGRVAGSGLFGADQLRRSPELTRLVDRYHRTLAQRKHAPAIADEGKGAVVYQASEIRARPDLLRKLFDASGEIARGPDGKPIINADGTPRFLSPKEVAAANRSVTDRIWQWYEANLTQRGGLHVEMIVEPGAKVATPHIVGPMPASLLEALAADRHYNPAQLDTLRLVSGILDTGPGGMISMFYQPATKGQGNTRYRSLRGDWRTEAPASIEVSKKGNLYIRTVSKEKLVANAEAMFMRGRGQLWGDNLADFMGDVDTYLANHAAGRGGADGIGMEKRDVINELFGVNNRNNASVNPLFDTLPKRSAGVFRSRRIDRMNRVVPVEGENFRVDYYKVRDNRRPEAPLDGGRGRSQNPAMESMDTPPARASSAPLTPAQEAWSKVKPGARFDAVKKFIPKSDIMASKLDFLGKDTDEVMQTIKDFLLSNPVVDAFDGKRVLIANPQGKGDGLLTRAEHLGGRRRKSMGSAPRDFAFDKAELVSSIPETLKTGAVKVEQGGDHLYFKKYKDGLLHMVVVDPHGFLSDHGPVDAGLVTQYTPEAKKRFEGARVLAKR
ncbi:MAG: hypothetical protein LBK99_14260 [Opitutaceae bacterium]|jgi:hypothetical protein|nr:hypothetical protein [Opitutaceae bacterium]